MYCLLYCLLYCLVYIWDWSQKHARKTLDLEETLCTICHASVKSVPGSVKFNAVFSRVPVAIGATLCLTPASAGTFRWACGTDLVSVYESHIEDSIDPSTTALKTTGALQRHVMPYSLRCSVKAEHLLWLDAKHWWLSRCEVVLHCSGVASIAVARSRQIQLILKVAFCCSQIMGPS